MTRISSKSTFFLKRVFPFLWFGTLALVLLAPFLATRDRRPFPYAVLLMPLFMAVIGIIVMKKLVFDLVDEVWDCGDALVVKDKGWEERIELTNIINVSSSLYTNPQRITLTLRDPCRFGKEVTFCPPATYIPFSRPRIASDLIERIEKKRPR